mgnify:CR=1 FL=1|tara:strand:+ start:173 stop:592 length:420 start_codon:yes stop_codon:yes gene_type:complete
MRRSASEILRSLEGRIARLESNKSSRKVGGFYGQYAKVDVYQCVIMLDTYDSSPAFDYCFMHLDKSVLNSAVKSFMSDMKEGERIGIIEDAWITSESKNAVNIRIEFSEESGELQSSDDKYVQWILDHCWKRPNTLNIG